MKLRMHGSSVRLRLTRPEVEAIGRGEQVQESARFPDGNVFVWLLTVVESGAITAHFDGHGIEVLVPRESAATWAHGDDVAIAAELVAGDGIFCILIEKDFDCLHPRAEDEGAATFPNPAMERS